MLRLQDSFRLLRDGSYNQHFLNQNATQLKML